MNRILVNLRDIQTERLQLGFEGENDHTQVIFDGTLLYARYPSAVASMTVKPPSGDLYPKELVKSGNQLIWNVSASDCAKAGSGQFQLTFTNGTEVIKTYIGSFSVNASLLGSGDPPDPVEDWLQEAQEALDAFEQDVSDAEAWAVGTRDGDPVGSTDPAYHNNSKYYAEQAGAIEQTIESTGAAQVAAIEAKGEEVLESIPSDYTALSEDVDELYAIKAPAITESASGSIATFTDGADDMPLKNLSVAIEPVQDLHGYDAPWPAGGGKNLFGGSYNELFELHIPSGTTVCTYCDNTSTINYYGADGQTRIDYWTVSSSARTFTLIADAYYFRFNGAEGATPTKMYVAIESGFSGYLPYSNICPITGWDGVTVTRTGKNLLNPTIASGTSAGLTATKQSDNSYKVTGTANSTNVNIWLKGGYITNAAAQLDASKIMFLKAGTIITHKDCKLFFYDIETRKLNQTFGINQIPLGAVAETLTIPRDSWLTGVRFPDAVNGETYDMTLYPQIELGSTSSAFEQYRSNTYQITFPSSAGTVYGGTLTIHQDGTGELVVDRAIADLGTLTWNYQSANTRFYSDALENIIKKPSVFTDTANAISSHYKIVNWDGFSSANDAIAVATSGNTFIRDTRYTDVASLTAALSGVQFVYELATPTTYQLTNQQVIETLKGVNNLWSSTGPVSVEYPADTRLFIEKRISELQALILENISNS